VVRDSLGKTERNFFVRAVSKYAIATDLQPRTEESEPRIHAGFCTSETGGGNREGMRTKAKVAAQFFSARSGDDGEVAKVVNKFFKFLFPPTTTTKPKRHENARRDFRAEQADEKTGRISATCTQARAVFAVRGATERSDYEHD
jgi:hypothetical protein